MANLSLDSNLLIKELVSMYTIKSKRFLNQKDSRENNTANTIPIGQ